ncbi:unnamed protein product [Enterobius vermicularis]|uniref:Sushi domain-containing protein n=1 Tax=Enterobius vermicularis TaxID=51028 RepID=A0A0N4VRR4_ENTVE|nr:unnamed protein product [Enterobius vermicularis]
MGTQIAAAQPLMPIGKVPRTMVPMSFQAPMCNPYVHDYALGVSFARFYSHKPLCTIACEGVSYVEISKRRTQLRCGAERM